MMAFDDITDVPDKQCLNTSFASALVFPAIKQGGFRV